MATAVGTGMAMPIPMTEEVEALRLFAWLSPGYPVGAYAYSHGLEAAVEAGDVGGEESLIAWLGDVCEHGSLRNDLILVARAHDAASAASATDLIAINDLALALAPSRELHLETSQQGRSFLDATLGAWPCRALTTLASSLAEAVAYPVAVGAAAGAHGMRLSPVLGAYALAFVQNLVSAALRSAPVGQAAGTRVVAALSVRLVPWQKRRRPRAWTILALPAFASISARSGTRRSIPASSGHEASAMSVSANGPLRVGIGGPVGSGKTALMEQLCKRFRDRYEICAITNDIYTKEDARILTVAGALPEERILGVETGGCPHTAIREDASINLAAVAQMRQRFPKLDLVLIESGGDNLAATFSPELADITLYVIDVAGGEKIPARGGRASPVQTC